MAQMKGDSGEHPDSISEYENKPCAVSTFRRFHKFTSSGTARPFARAEMSLTTVDHRAEEAGAVVKYRLSEVLPCSGNGVDLNSELSVAVVTHHSK